MALNFHEPDRVPRYQHFWSEFAEAWRAAKGLGPEADPMEYYGGDMVVVPADETAWPSRAGTLEENEEGITTRTGWGSVWQFVNGTSFFVELEPALPERVDPDTLEFDDPLLDSRYDAAAKRVERYRGRCAVFAKTGGPYMRASYTRTVQRFLMDIAEDPEWVKALVDRVTDHILQVGVEQIRRFGLQSTGIGIYDDIATNEGLIMGLASYEKIFYPALRKMVKAYKEAGASKVFHHCDGRVDEVLDLWVEAGIDAVHPLEARCSMHAVEVRERYDGKLAVIGGLDNCNILPRGNRDEIREHVLYLLQAGRGGGFVLAGHSIGPDISVETYDYVCELLGEYGTYPLRV